MRTRLSALTVVTLTSLAACQVGQELAQSSGAADGTADPTAATVQQVRQQLHVDPDRCRGCGKCVRIDPAHFAFDAAANRSVVRSSVDLGSPALAQAIAACRDGAISIT